MKICTKCKTEKHLYDFHKKASGADGMCSSCKQCRKAYSFEWRKNNRQKHRSYSSAWQRSNYEKARARSDSWSKAHPQIGAAKSARYIAAQLRATPAWANDFFISEAYDLARLRTKATGFRWHVDHSVPLNSKIVCGLHVEHNLEVIPATINQAKSNRYWPNMP